MSRASSREAAERRPSARPRPASQSEDCAPILHHLSVRLPQRLIAAPRRAPHPPAAARELDDLSRADLMGPIRTHPMPYAHIMLTCTHARCDLAHVAHSPTPKTLPGPSKPDTPPRVPTRCHTRTGTDARIARFKSGAGGRGHGGSGSGGRGSAGPYHGRAMYASL